MSSLEDGKDIAAVEGGSGGNSADNEGLLLLRITQGHLHLQVEGMMRVVLPIALVFIVYNIYHAGVAAGRRQAGAMPELKLGADQDATAYIQYINATLGELIRELQGVMGKLAVLEEKHKG